MINMLIFGCGPDEAETIRQLSSDAVAYICDEKLNIELDNLELEKAPEIAVVNICGKEGIANAEKVRNVYKDVEILLISNTSVSPMEYLNPHIHPLSLIIKPYGQKELFEVIKPFIQKIVDEREGGIWVDAYDGKIKVLFSNILYVEARNKMLNIRLESVEYCVYGSLDQYEKVLPSAFSRCHRGMIVNTRYINKIKFSENYIRLKNGEMIPLSRSYKQNFKEMMKQ